MFDLLMIILCSLVIYHHVGFPLILKMLKPQRTLNPAKSYSMPSISLIIPAFNEERTIASKILNTAKLSYPREKLEVIIVCDGCTDRTFEIAQDTIFLKQSQELPVRLIKFEKNRGKIAVLNDAIAKSSSDIIALSDCSTSLSPDTLHHIAHHFANPTVGVVGGAYHFVHSIDPAEQTYWAYQRAIKKGEACLGAPMGMHGAFYAFRKSLSQPMPTNTINDDFILPMKIVAKGYDAIYDENLICLETEQTTPQMNWKRRLRIAAGNVQQTLYCLDLFTLKRPGISFAFFSGKFLRAWMPFFLLAIFLLSGWKAPESSVYFNFFALQFIGLSLISLPLPHLGYVTKIILTLRYILIGHLAGLIGAMTYLCAQHNGSWKRAS